MCLTHTEAESKGTYYPGTYYPGPKVREYQEGGSADRDDEIKNPEDREVRRTILASDA